MKVVSVKTRELRKMPLLQISNKIVSTEGRLYLYNGKDKWQHLQELLKIYYNQSDAYISDKLYVITQLLANEDVLQIPELVLPSALVSLDDSISGFAMPYIENVNLSQLINNQNVNLEIKLKYLKEIYALLDKLLKIKKLEGNFYLGDIHEANFILDIDKQIVRAIDMDSCYINKSPVGVSKFLTFNEKLLNNPIKYPHNEEDRPIPNENTTYLSFIYMLLNVLSGCKDSHKWSSNELYGYLSYLSKRKVSKELVDVMANVYTNNTNNYFPVELLDSINLQGDYTLQRARVPRSSTGYYGG